MNLGERVGAVADFVEAVLREAVHGFARRGQDDLIAVASEDDLRQAVGEPGGNLDGAAGNGRVAVGDLQQERGGDRTGKTGAVNHVRQFHATVPRAEKWLGGEKNFIVQRPRRTQGEDNFSAPWRVRFQAQFARQGAFETLGGDGEQGGFEPDEISICLLYTSPSPRDRQKARMPSSA